MKIRELAIELGVSGLVLRRLAKLGLIPAKRLPTKSAHWRFAEADVPKIRGVLVDAGMIEESAKKK